MRTSSGNFLQAGELELVANILQSLTGLAGIITNHFNEQVRQGAKEDWESDSYAIPAINEKITLLSPQKRELAELFIDALLRGEEITFEPKPKA